MPILRSIIWILSFSIAMPGTSLVIAQNFPNKPIRMITSGIGSGTDFAARLTAQGLSRGIDQQVIIDNRPSGVIPGDMVAKAPPDGYTLLVAGGPLWLMPFLQSNVPYDVVKDFAPLTVTDTTPSILVVHPSLPVKTVKDLIDLARKRPGELNYASATIGSTSHLGAELFKHMARVNIVRIPYGSGSGRNADLVGGHVQLEFATSGTVTGQLQSGRLRGLAVTSAQPSRFFPGLPTIAASGLPGYESVSIHAVFAPAKTPAAIINFLNQELVRGLNRPDVKEKFTNAGAEVAGSTAQELAVMMKSEMTRMGKVIKDAGIRAD